MAGGIQTQVNVAQAPGVAGDWASGNPRTYYTAGPGGLVSGPSGLIVGRFAWALWSGLSDLDSAPTIASNTYGGIPMGVFGFGGAGGAAPTGFVHREQQGLNTTFLLDASMTIPQGFPVGLCTGADVWVANDGSGAAYPGYQAFADFATGKISFLAGGSAASGGTVATSAITAATNAVVTGGIAGNLLTVSVVSSGTIYVGMKITSGAATGTVVTGQVTPLLAGEAAGGVGRYYVSIPQSVASGSSLTIGGYVLTLGATPSTPVKVGSFYTFSTTNAGYVTQSVSGSGGTTNGDVLAVLPTVGTTLSSNTVAFTTNVGTKWFAQSGGAAGELIKMTSWALG